MADRQLGCWRRMWTLSRSWLEDFKCPEPDCLSMHLSTVSARLWEICHRLCDKNIFTHRISRGFEMWGLLNLGWRLISSSPVWPFSGFELFEHRLQLTQPHKSPDQADGWITIPSGWNVVLENKLWTWAVLATEQRHSLRSPAGVIWFWQSWSA